MKDQVTNDYVESFVDAICTDPTDPTDPNDAKIEKLEGEMVNALFRIKVLEEIVTSLSNNGRW